jgi:7-cyano-7-deazaguanine tRNA-ribosyltransferase
VTRFAELNPETAITVAHYGWPDRVVRRLPDGVASIDLADRS